MAMRNLPSGLAERAAELRTEGIPDAEIARRLDISSTSIRYWLGPKRAAPYNSNDARKSAAKRLRRDDRLSNTQIAERMGVTHRTVHAWIGPQPKDYTYKRVSDAVYEEAVRLRVEEKISNAEIARLVGVNESTVYRWMGANPFANRRRKDYSHFRYHNRAMYLRECGYTIREIAKVMSVPRSTVGDWLKGFGCYGQPIE